MVGLILRERLRHPPQHFGNRLGVWLGWIDDGASKRHWSKFVDCELRSAWDLLCAKGNITTASGDYHGCRLGERDAHSVSTRDSAERNMDTSYL